MNARDKVHAMLEDSAEFPPGTAFTVEAGDARGLYTVRIEYPPTTEPEDFSEWVRAVIAKVQQVLELAITRSVISAPGEGVRTEVREQELRIEGPTGPIVELDIIGVLLEDA